MTSTEASAANTSHPTVPQRSGPPAGVDKSGERVQKMFGEIAPRYDRMNHLLSMNVDRWWRRVAVGKLAPEPGNRILDVCTGTGDLALAFLRRMDGNVTVTGSDFCPEMLEIARHKSRHDSGIDFVQADTQNLPFEDDSFDIVTVAFGLRNVEDTDRGLRELQRVCRVGGRIGILEFSTPRRWPVRPLYGWYFRNILPRIGQRLAGNNMNAYDYLPQSVGEFPAYEQLTGRMKAAGMRTARFWPLTFGIATLYVGEK
jgi:demethylmenaquinone methyltransferase/2-methoxy-6-polyprenyl-1,4-benzoquinol methylase